MIRNSNGGGLSPVQLGPQLCVAHSTYSDESYSIKIDKRPSVLLFSFLGQLTANAQ